MVIEDLLFVPWEKTGDPSGQFYPRNFKYLKDDKSIPKSIVNYILFIVILLIQILWFGSLYFVFISLIAVLCAEFGNIGDWFKCLYERIWGPHQKLETASSKSIPRASSKSISRRRNV